MDLKEGKHYTFKSRTPGKYIRMQLVYYNGPHDHIGMREHFSGEPMGLDGFTDLEIASMIEIDPPMPKKSPDDVSGLL